MTTTVSVIIPTFNRAHLINRAIQSVLSQTYRDFELIIIDDASNDGTEETAKKIISSNKSFHDPQIIYIKNRVRKGGSAARNIGIKLAKGKYIAFLDDDDEWLPTKLSEQVNIMNRSNENVGAVYAGFKWIFENGKTFEVLPRYEGHVFDNLLSKNCIGPTSTVLVKKKVLEEVGGFDEKLPLYQDWDLWLRIGKSYEFKYVPKILVNYYVHKNRSSKNSRAQLLAHVRFFNKYKNHLTSSELKASHYFLLGELLYLNANINSGRRYILASLFKCCKSPRQIFHNLNCIFHVTLSLSGPLTFSRLHSFLLNSRYPLIFRKYFDL